MKFQKLKCSDYKIFNPTTQEVIVDEECNDNAKSLIAYWLVDSISKPVIKHEKLRALWESFLEKSIKKSGDSPDWNELCKFVENYNSMEWIGYDITSDGIPCYSVIYIVEKEVVVEELV